MSTPAWKPLPSARKITARTSRSLPAPRRASASWNQPATGSAFTGGLSIVTISTWSRRSVRIMWSRLSWRRDSHEIRVGEQVAVAHAQVDGVPHRRCLQADGAGAAFEGAPGHGTGDGVGQPFAPRVGNGADGVHARDFV